MRIIFIGAVEFSLKVLVRLTELNAKVVGVCTTRGSTFNSDHVDLSNFSQSHEIPSLYVGDINSEETYNWIQDKSPDVIFCFGWSSLIKKNLLELAPLGVIGFHPAALPANRGRHPIVWALILGLRKTASTFFFMDSGADSGDILSQKEILITDKDDARSLYDKVVNSALTQITEFLPQLSTKSFQRVKQNQLHSNYWRKRVYADGQIDWRMSAKNINNLVRGLAAPYVGAHFLFHGKEIKVWKSAIFKGADDNIEFGKVLYQTNNELVVKCGEGAISLLVTEPELKVKDGTYL